MAPLVYCFQPILANLHMAWFHTILNGMLYDPYMPYNGGFWQYANSPVAWSMSFGFYIYYAICLYNVGRKFNDPNPWYAWIPILNIWYTFVLAEMNGCLMFILFLIPPVTIIVWIIAWWRLAERAGKPGWLSLLWFIPAINLVVPGIVAF